MKVKATIVYPITVEIDVSEALITEHPEVVQDMIHRAAIDYEPRMSEGIIHQCDKFPDLVE